MTEKPTRPEFIEQAAEKIAEELVEHLAARIWDKDREFRQAVEIDHFGQAAPALILAVMEKFKDKAEATGAGAVQDYVDSRGREGVGAGTAQGEELGPLMAMSRIGVYHSFGRRNLPAARGASS